MPRSAFLRAESVSYGVSQVAEEVCGVRRFLASALAVALTLLAAEGLMVYISAHPDTTCGLTMAATPST
ncbi:MAG TPA: hypothetical protein VH393_12040, partial [Ktedonobacterales bacterium]